MPGEVVQMEAQGISAAATEAEGAVGPQASVVNLLAVYDSSPPGSQALMPSNIPNLAHSPVPDTTATLAMLPAAIDPTQTHSAQNDGTTSGDQAQQNPAPDTSIKRKRSSESSTSSSAAAAPPASESEDSCTVPAKKSKKKSKKQRKKERKIWKQGIGAMARDTDAPSDEEEEKPASDPKAEEGSDEEGEKTEGAKVKEAKQKKGVFAKEARWDDIPDWKGRGDCPLLDLPAEILDRCFGLTKDLDARDYVALAGTCKFFRHHFTDTFFHELCFDCSITRPRQSYHYFSRAPEPLSKPDTNHSKSPFSRVVEPWRVSPTAPQRSRMFPKKKKASSSSTEAPSTRPPSYYVPRGDRSTWTEAQYTVYKEEKSAWKVQEKARKKAERAAAEAEAEEKRRKEKPMIRVGYANRTVLAIVHGRMDGEPAVVKDDKGIPLPGQNGPKRPTPGAKWGSAADLELEDAGKELWTSMRKRKASDLASGRSSSSPGSTAKRGKPRKWVTPDTDTDTDSETDQEPTRVDDSGETKKVHEYWPSKYRGYVADHVNAGRINRSDALKQFKVTEAQLITLKHYLLPAKMGGRRPEQSFSLAAVEALALRAHGGAAGHEAHIKQSEELSSRRTETKRANLKAKIEKAKADGTYVRPKKKVPVPPYAYYWREDFCLEWYHDNRSNDDFDINDYEELVEIKQRTPWRFSSYYYDW